MDFSTDVDTRLLAVAAQLERCAAEVGATAELAWQASAADLYRDHAAQARARLTALASEATEVAGRVADLRQTVAARAELAESFIERALV